MYTCMHAIHMQHARNMHAIHMQHACMHAMQQVIPEDWSAIATWMNEPKNKGLSAHVH